MMNCQINSVIVDKFIIKYELLIEYELYIYIYNKIKKSDALLKIAYEIKIYDFTKLDFLNIK